MLVDILGQCLTSKPHLSLGIFVQTTQEYLVSNAVVVGDMAGDQSMSASGWLVEQWEPHSVEGCDLQNLGESQLPRRIAFQMDIISEQHQ